MRQVINGFHLLTLSDLAPVIALDKSANGISRAHRQLRRWTQFDLLRPYGAKASGKGNHRLYDEEPTVQVAAILIELQRYKVPVEIMKPVTEALYDDIYGGSEVVFISMTWEGNAYLQLIWEDDPETGQFTNAKIHLFHNAEVTEHHRGELDKEPVSSIILNLNKIMDRVFPLPWVDEQ